MPELLIEIPVGLKPTRVYWTQFNEALLVCFEDGWVRKYDPKVRSYAPPLLCFALLCFNLGCWGRREVAVMLWAELAAELAPGLTFMHRMPPHHHL